MDNYDATKLNIHEAYEAGEITAEEKEYLLEQADNELYFDTKLSVYEAYEAGEITAEEKEAYLTYLEAGDDKPTKKEIEDFFDRLKSGFSDYSDDIEELRDKLTGDDDSDNSSDDDSDDDND